ncbi:amphoterin-induced protein 2-like [Lethenteron reissneri]|uniref:amphoterin-induced protein 2-like n=1 Tax=Lethenteron reissneri TaxID=7753 RepID=UPI002AB6B1EE|nr:amphoterin-induced protein 2-like [Lethenteron reissneri]XP_061418798.1 amphoterin-induced protein 2-like [Lethenteron reissneri]
MKTQTGSILGERSPPPQPPLLLWLLALLPFSSGHRHPPLWAGEHADLCAIRGDCVCAGEIVDCSGANLSSLLPLSAPDYASVLDLSRGHFPAVSRGWLSGARRLRSLSLRHCGVRNVSASAFDGLSRLARLDLSSNRLRTVSRAALAGLASLEELLLYNNRIAEVEALAFADARSLRRVLLARNALDAFPADAWPSGALARVHLLDLSYNRIEEVPVARVGSLPAALRQSLLLHGNPLRCSCALYLMLMSWMRHELTSVRRHHRELTCRLPHAREPIRLFQVQEDLMGCSPNASLLVKTRSEYSANVGDTLLLQCDSRLALEPSTTFAWLDKGGVRHVHPHPRRLDNGSSPLYVHANGSLEIRDFNAKLEGTYACQALNLALELNETLWVNVTVAPPAEPFNTAFTTLIASSAILFVVLVYLFLPPCDCHCRSRRCGGGRCGRCCCCCRYVGVSGCQAEDAAMSMRDSQASILSNATMSPPTPPQQQLQMQQQQKHHHQQLVGEENGAGQQLRRKLSGVKRVSIMEPEGQGAHNGRACALPSDDFHEEHLLKILKMKSDSESNCSVYSDTPIVSL